MSENINVWHLCSSGM